MPVGEKPDYKISGLSDIHYNPLQQYRNVTYNVRWTMMPVIETYLTREDRSYDHKKGIVMFETGGTGTMTLDEMTMETYGTGNPTGNYMVPIQHNFRGRLVEPIGGRFIEALSLAALKLDYPNNDQALYLLEIWFVGYNDEDLPVVCEGWDGEPLEYRYYVNLKSLKMQLDFRGAVYDFEMTPSHARGLLGDYMNLEQGFRLTANPKTIGDFCKNLETALNKREEDKVKSGLRCHPHKYVITAHKKIRDMKFEYNFFSRGNWSWAIGAGETQIEAGTTLPNFIVNTLNNSKDLMKFMHKVDEGKKDYNSPDTKPNSIAKIPRIVSIMVGSKAQRKGDQPLFDPKLSGTADEIHLFVTTKEDGKLIISPQEYEDAKNPAQRNDRVQRWIDLGLLKKAYKWIYSGENTEVLTANIQLNYLWRLVRPLWIDSETGKPVAIGSVQPPAKEVPAGKNTSKVATCEGAKQVNTWTPAGEVLYSEDLPFRPGQAAKDDISPHAGWLPNMPQFYHANIQVQQSQTQSSYFEESAQEYSVYRQLHNQIGAGDQDLFKLDIEVVGDPYYLMQIPSQSGKSPWEDDIWEYEKQQWDDETLAEKRKKTATHHWLPIFYFEANVPSANLNEEDLMDLRESDAITGVYGVRKITNVFSKGKFTTKLDSYKDILANPWSDRAKQGPSTSNSKAINAGSANAVGPKSAGTTSTSSEADANIGLLGP